MDKLREQFEEWAESEEGILQRMHWDSGIAIWTWGAYQHAHDTRQGIIKRLARAIIDEQENAMCETCVFCGGIQDAEDISHYHDCDYIFALEVVSNE